MDLKRVFPECGESERQVYLERDVLEGGLACLTVPQLMRVDEAAIRLQVAYPGVGDTLALEILACVGILLNEQVA